MESVCLDAPSIDDIEEPLPEPTPMPALNTVYLGDCVNTMSEWPSEFVDCVVTSVPYYNQRSYLPAGHASKRFEIGCNVGLGVYLDDLRRVFQCVRRRLKPSGVCWINAGDTYDKLKGLIGVPWLLAQTLKDDGWILRQAVIWEKPNCLSEAANDRPVTSHEYLFQFVKSANYFWDWYAIREASGGKKTKPKDDEPKHRRPRSVWSIPTVSLNGRKLMADFKDHRGVYREVDDACPEHGLNAGDNVYLPLFLPKRPRVACTCNPVDADFFAAMPPALAEKCILSSTSEVGNCSVCGAPVNRVLNKQRKATRPGVNVKVDPSRKARKDPGRHVTHVSSLGWARQCLCDGINVPPIVFDPFLGSGTTAVVAAGNGRNWLGCELNPLMVEKLIPARLKAGL